MKCQRVLVIEDNEDTRESLAQLLRMNGHEVDVAADGPQGLKKVLSWRPDVAVVDVGLPGCDGFEVARRVRTWLGRNIRLVAVTAYSFAAVEAFQAGFDAFLAKPAEPNELERLVSSACAYPSVGPAAASRS